MLQKLYQKTKGKGLVKALSLLVGLGLTSPALAKDNDKPIEYFKINVKPKGYFEAAGEIAQFTGDNYLTEVYGNAFGGSVGGGVRVKGPLHVGGRLTFLTGSGDLEKERSFFSQKSETQTLTIVGLEPYLELNIGESLFTRMGYGSYSVFDKLREQERSFFKEKYSEDTYKDHGFGMFYGAGARIPLTAVNSEVDGSLMIEFNSRNASPVKTLSARVGVDLNF